MNKKNKSRIIALIGLLVMHSSSFAQTPNTAAGFRAMYEAKNDFTWSGSDQGTTFRASNGHIYWIHADTILGTENPITGAYNTPWKMVGNTILREDNGVLVNAITETSPTAVSAAAPDPSPANGSNNRYWLQGMFEANGYAYGLAQNVYKPAGGSGGSFAFHGNEFAKFSFNSTGAMTFVGMVNSPMTGVAGSSYYASEVYGGYVYVFGKGGAGGPSGNWVHRCLLANVENPASWEFWKGGTTWSTGAAGRLNIPINNDKVESVRVINGKWVFFFKPYGSGSGYSDHTQYYIGTSPVGPFTPANPTRAFSEPWRNENGIEFRNYCAQLHPEYTLASGKILASLAWNGDYTLQSADYYKPTFYEVALPGIRLPINETESLTVVSKSSDDHVLLEFAPFSNRYGTQLRSNAIGDYVTYLVSEVPAGTYNVKVGMKKFVNRGQFQMSVAPVGGSFTNVGSVQNQHSTIEEFSEVDLGSWTPTTSGDKHFKFTVTGKSSSSNGYNLAFDYIKLTPQ
jgi:hypothetical protein